MNILTYKITLKLFPKFLTNQTPLQLLTKNSFVHPPNSLKKNIRMCETNDHYFVRERCEPVVTGFTHRGAAQAEMPRALAEVRDVEAVIVCPSNPFISIAPILAVPGMRDWLKGLGAPVVAVSPLIGGQAVKGPTAKMFAELGLDVTNAGLVAHYGGLLDGLVIDHADGQNVHDLSVATAVTATLMQTAEDRHRVADIALSLVEAIKEHVGS